MVKAKIACVSCAARERDSAARASSPSPAVLSQAANSAGISLPVEESSPYPRALLYGTAAAVAGLVLYASFTIITHMYLGYVAVLVGLMVGKAMMQGSGGVVGHATRSRRRADLCGHLACIRSDSNLRGTQSRVRNRLGNDAGPLLVGGIVSPFLKLAQGAYGIIGLVILFVGCAWPSG